MSAAMQQVTGHESIIIVCAFAWIVLANSNPTVQSHALALTGVITPTDSEAWSGNTPCSKGSSND